MVPEALRKQVLHLGHDHVLRGHYDRAKTHERLREKFWWPGMYKDVQSWVQQCEDCQRRKRPGKPWTGAMQPLEAVRPLHLVGVDHLGPFPTSLEGNKYLLVMMDHFTKWGEAYPVPDVTAETTARVILERWILQLGAPEVLVSDRGTAFLAEITQVMARTVGALHTPSTSYHPQTNGLVERFNRTLLDAISIAVGSSKETWDQVVPYVCASYRWSPQGTTGESPFFLMYLRDPNLPALEDGHKFSEYLPDRLKKVEVIYDSLRLRFEEAREKMIEGHPVSKEELDPGTFVWLHRPNLDGEQNKLGSHWSGPYRVLARRGESVYQVRNVHNPGDVQVVNVNRLKQAYFSLERQASLEPREEAGEATPGDQEYEVEAVLKHRKHKGRLQYLVKWKGWMQKWNSWVWEEDLQAQKLVEDYWRRVPSRPKRNPPQWR